MYSLKQLFIGISILVSICLGTNLLAQDNLREILHSSRDFSIITERVDAYFAKKYPGKSPIELTNGMHRDGEFVKYMRWQSFWSKRLTTDGQLGNLVVEHKKKEKAQNRSWNPYKNIQWSNISHQNHDSRLAGMGRTTSIGFHPTNPSIFYVGTAMGGIWKTENGGHSYTPLGDKLPYLAVSAIIVDSSNPSTIYIAISDPSVHGLSGIGVYRSTNEGLTWQPTVFTFDFDSHTTIYQMKACPVNPDKIFIGTSKGLYKTNDGFNSVERINIIKTLRIEFKPNDPNTIYQGGVCGELLKSTDGGDNFTFNRNFSPDRCISEAFLMVSPTDPERLYVLRGEELLKSYDGGNTFPNDSTRLFPETQVNLIFAPTNPNIIIGGFIDIVRSDDGGANFYPITSWTGRNGLPLIHADQRNIFTNPLKPDFIYFCNDGGVVKYQISTNLFEDLSDGLVITQFYDIAVAQTNVNVIGGGSQDNGNMFRDANGVWQQYIFGGDGMTQAIDPTDHSIRYWTYQLGDLHRWQNGVNVGISPPEQAGKGAWETPFRLDPNNPKCIIAGYERVYKSLDRGDTWTPISPVLNASRHHLSEIAIAPSNSDRIYATTSLGVLYVKNINATTWEEKTIPNTVFISDLEVDPFDMNTIYVSNSFVGSENKVLKSTDAGDTWVDITCALPNYPTGAIEVYTRQPGGIFVGTVVGVYYKDDSLADWLEIGELPHTMVEDIEINYPDNLIRIGTYGRGIFEAAIAAIATSSNQVNVGNEDLFELYPNPANTVLSVRFQDVSTSKLIMIYNELGQIVAERSVLGQASTTFGFDVSQFDVSQIPAGIYKMVVVEKGDNQTTTAKSFVKL